MSEVRVAEAGELAGLVAVEDAADTMFGPYGIVFPPSPDIDQVADPADVFVVGRPAVGFAYVGDVDDGLQLHQLAVPGPKLARLVEGERWLADLGERVTLTSKVMFVPTRCG